MPNRGRKTSRFWRVGHVSAGHSRAGEEMLHSWATWRELDARGRESRAERESARETRVCGGQHGHVARSGWLDAGTRDPCGRERRSGWRARDGNSRGGAAVRATRAYPGEQADTWREITGGRGTHRTAVRSGWHVSAWLGSLLLGSARGSRLGLAEWWADGFLGRIGLFLGSTFGFCLVN